MRPHAHPFARLLVPFGAGILFGESTGLPASFLPALLAAGLVFIALFSFRESRFEERHLFGVLAAAFFFLLGWQLVFSKNETRAPHHFSKMMRENEGQTGSPLGGQNDGPYFVAMLEEPPSRTAKKLRARCSVRAIGPSPDSLKNCSGNLLVYLDTTLAAANFRYGDLLVFRSKIQPVPPPRNPSGFDYQKYLHFQSVHYQSFIPKNDCQRLASGLGNPLWRWAFASRDRCLAILQKHFPRPDELAVASALLIGYKAGLSDEIKNAYVETGSMHALAVSGMHVAGLYLPLAYFFRKLPKRNRFRRLAEPVVSLLVIWGFALVTGASSSVLRAALMFTIVIVGRAARRDASIYNTLAASAFLLLCCDPYFLFDAGFQLSYAAVAGIVFFGQKLTALWHPPRGLGWAWDTVAIGLAAQIATLPISLYHFHQMPSYFWLSGLVVIPVGTGILWSGMAPFLLDGLAPLIAAWIGKAMFWVVWLMNQIIFVIQKLPGSLVEGIRCEWWTALLIYFLTAALTGFLMFRRPRWVLATLAGLMLLAADRAAGRLFQQADRSLTFYSINGKSLVDFRSGEQLVSLTDSISGRDLSFAAGSAGRVGAAAVFMEKDTSFQTADLFWDPPFAQFFEKRMAVVGPGFSFLKEGKEAEPVAVDYVLFRHDPPVSIEEAMAAFPCRAFVFDASNRFSRVKKWSAECAALGIECHDLRNEGAFVVDW